MKTSPLAVAGLIALFLAGCRTNPNIVLLERENRLLEDEVYRLRGVIQGYEEGGTPLNCVAEESAQTAPDEIQMQKNRESTASPGKTLAPWRKKSESLQEPPPINVVPGEPMSPGETPRIFKPSPETNVPGEPGRLNLPEVPKQRQGPSGPNLPGPRGSGKNGSSKDTINPTSGFEPIALADSKDVGQLVLNRMLTGGYSAEVKSGDDGVLVVLEPRDAKGRRLDAPADVAVVLLDPAKTGDQARVARWDFTAEETANHFGGSGIARGMYIECPWPGNPPQNNQLHLFVRYTTRDGRKLQADQPIEIALRGEKSARWTPAEGEPQSASASEIQPASSESDAETAVAETDEAESYADDTPPPRRFRSLRNATRNNSGRLQRPAWSPERF